jgi:hypothetical protein
MAKPCPAAPAIPLDLLWKGLGQNCFGPANIEILHQDTELPNLQFRAQQIFYIVDWARTHLEIDPTIGSLERAFNCSRHAIHSALANGLSEPRSRGRHLAVNAESEANILAWITSQAEKNAAVTRTEIMNYCREVCKIAVTRGWVDSFISRHSAELIEKKSSPQEEPRLQVPRIFLDQTGHSMHGAVQDRPTDLVFNLDEVGISDWEDRQPKKVVVPITAALHSIHHRLSRSVKHISVVACISASGACLTPYVVTSQDSAAVRRDLEADGMQIGRHLILEDRDKPYVNAELFEDYLRSVLLPYLLITRILKDLREEDAVLLMDNCSPHLTPAVMELLSSARVRVVTFAPHTTQIFQVLDLTLFCVLKRRGQYQLPLGDDAGSARFIRKMYHDFRMTMIEPNIWGAFRGIGVKYSVVDRVQRVSFDEMILRESEGFKELWDIDFPLAKLSPRRQSCTFGWINEPE